MQTKVYILQNKEQIISDMDEPELCQYCEQHGLIKIMCDTAYAHNDMNWFRQYANKFILCAKSIDEAKDFILHGFYRSHEFDGERGVIFRRLEPQPM